ncbi:MAG TPA: BON domain-containing protein [Actinomycetota bacterium]|nr:BON domain-containing protein [Actinomycetota bacterium]
MTTRTMKRKARRRIREARREARLLGGTVRSAAGDLGGTVRSKAGEVGGTVRARAGKVGERAAATTRGTRRRVGYWIAGEEPPKSGTGRVLLAGAAGAAAAFFLDPTNGKRRRHVAADWIGARVRGAGRTAGRVGRGIGARTYGVTQSTRHLTEADRPENDATLSHKVESEVLGRVDLPAGRINVNAELGVVTLRGSVDRPEQIEDIEARTRRVNGVRDVQNLLHLSGTSAPTS